MCIGSVGAGEDLDEDVCFFFLLKKDEVLACGYMFRPDNAP